jgi:hypothetical protein
MKYILIALFAIGFTAQAQACKAPSKSQLKDFFDKTPKWTEVKNKNSNKIERSNTVRFRINFANVKRSVVSLGSRKYSGRDLQICYRSKNRLLVKAKGYKIHLYKRNKYLQSRVNGFGGEHIWYYKPSSRVSGERASVSSSWNVAELPQEQNYDDEVMTAI